MGICTSIGAMEEPEMAAAAGAWAVMPDGTLRELDLAAGASQVLGKEADEWGPCFVCDADEMEFDAYVRAVGADEELRPGQLYFLLPRSMLKHPLHAEDMAALAARASKALTETGGGRCRRVEAEPVDLEVRSVVRKRRRGSKRGGGRKRKFTRSLSVIPE